MLSRRRTFVRFMLSAGGLTLPVPALAQQLPRTFDTSPRARAIRTLRVVNTLQHGHFRTGERYLSLKELMEHETADQLLSQLPEVLILPGVSVLTGELLDGFTTTFFISEDRTSYTVVLKNLLSAQSFKTDTSGVIEEGTTSGIAFAGTPIRRPNQGPQNPRPASVLASLLAFFVPVAHAQNPCDDGDYWCCETGFPIGCSGGCTTGCNCCGSPFNCCNLGFQVCTWCCQVYTCSCSLYCGT